MSETSNNRSFTDRAVAARVVLESVFYTPQGFLALRSTTYSEDGELEVRCFGLYVSTGILAVRRTTHGSWSILAKRIA
jgi:hypothetical protein